MLFSLLLTLAVAAAADEKPAYARPQMLVEPAGLLKMKPGRDAVVLDARPRKDYDAGHMPGAAWVDVAAWSKAVNAGEGRDRWVERVGKLGIDGSLPVVVYDEARPL